LKKWVDSMSRYSCEHNEFDFDKMTLMQKNILFDIFQQGDDTLRLGALDQVNAFPTSSKAAFLEQANLAYSNGTIKTGNEVHKSVIDKSLMLKNDEHYNTIRNILLNAVKLGNDEIGVYAIEQSKPLKSSQGTIFLDELRSHIKTNQLTVNSTILNAIRKQQLKQHLKLLPKKIFASTSKAEKPRNSQS
jgi:hypothetical protein